MNSDITPEVFNTNSQTTEELTQTNKDLAVHPLASFVGAIYMSRSVAKTIKASDLKKLEVKSLMTEEEISGIVQISQFDRNLELPAKLLKSVASFNPNSPLMKCVSELCENLIYANTGVIALGKGLKSNREIFQLPLHEVASRAKGITASDLPILDESEKAGAKFSRDKFQANLIRCIGMTRISNGNLSLEDLIDELYEATWKSSRHHSKESALNLLHSKEHAALALIHVSLSAKLQDSQRLLNTSNTLYRAKQEEFEILESEKLKLQTDILEAKKEIERLEKEIEELKSEALSEQIRLEGKLQNQRTELVRFTRNYVDLLGDGLIALDNGRVEVAQEYIHRTLEALKKSEINLNEK